MSQLAEPGFAARVCDAFGLDADVLRLDSLPGSSTWLWSLQTRTGRLVIKEFRYEQAGGSTSLEAAAEFEHSLWRTAMLTMPEPVRATDNRHVYWLIGSRGARVAVRASLAGRDPRPGTAVREHCRGRRSGAGHHPAIRCKVADEAVGKSAMVDRRAGRQLGLYL